MAPNHKNFYNLGLRALPPIKNHENPNRQPPHDPTPDSAFPLLAIVVLSIMATVFLLASYYIFVTKCCSNWHHQLNLLRRISMLRARQNEDSFIVFSPTTWHNRGLHESIIRGIPTFQFKGGDMEERSVFGCVVCLNEFQIHDTLRVLPNCSHAFHLDCIDIWLQSNASCPLCRTSISGTIRYPIDHIIAPSSSPQDSDHQLYSNNLMGSEEDFVVIELGEEDEVTFPQRQSRQVLVQPRSQSPRKMEQKVGKIKGKKCHHGSIMGDECIDVRDKDDQFSIQPIRRSFSWDSAADRQLYLTVQAIVQHKSRPCSEVSTSGGVSDNRATKTFFPFRQGRLFSTECDL
ncbi:hypothetical protein FNV43_RR23258 [Rhamnella rubrinervis]|uniref:RING-type E3 ubiquitin transferase n=1 Tax=Rhamnella rubrinervis TaxID=2594499 RepID=A0A8K0GST2_9ROSA|nr:hypothetical protein FNV43_RR23258 [Rhamnella rubrinervis]